MSHARDKGRPFIDTSNRVELVATIVMSLAAIFTAWAAFQSAKWSGIQATSFAQAGAARTESTRADTQAGQETGIDVATFVAWLEAINEEMETGEVVLTGPPYEPTAGTLSGFLYERFRSEFVPAFDAWAGVFLTDRDTAPPTPFAMEEYVVENRLIADDLRTDAEDLATKAGQANQNSDNYVLTAVAFALCLFFAGVSSKLVSPRNSLIAVIMSTAIFIGATVVLLILPKVNPF